MYTIPLSYLFDVGWVEKTLFVLTEKLAFAAKFTSLYLRYIKLTFQDKAFRKFQLQI